MTRRGPRSARPDRPARTPRVPRGDLAALQARLTDVIGPVTERAGLDLEQVAVSRVGRRHSVRVVVDGDDAGLDTIAEVSRAVSTALDAADETGAAVVPGEYVLEVSSPGVDRPLTEPRHWRRNVGRLVAATVTDEGGTAPGGRGPYQVTGRIAAAGTEGVDLDIGGQRRRVRYERLGPGRVQVELRHLEEGNRGEGDRT